MQYPVSVNIQHSGNIKHTVNIQHSDPARCKYTVYTMQPVNIQHPVNIHDKYPTHVWCKKCCVNTVGQRKFKKYISQGNKRQEFVKFTSSIHVNT